MTQLQDSSLDWRNHLQSLTKGAKGIDGNLLAVTTVLDNWPEIAGGIRYDAFNRRIDVSVDLPWERTQKGPWNKDDSLRLAEHIQKLGINVGIDAARDGLRAFALKSQFHPVKEYFEALTWDKTPRIGSWLTSYLGAGATAYTAAVGRKFLISVVARALQPGCKVDTMMILEGAQGAGKSTALKVLIGEEWFADQLPDLSSKDASIQLAGKLLVEVAELDAMRGRESTTIKAFLSRPTDRYRPPYGREAEDHPRQSVLAGTTNSDQYLTDSTGNRRFWPVAVGKIDLERLANDRDQLWAEAVHAFKSGEIWHLTADEQTLAAAEQGLRYEEDAWAELIDSFIWKQDRVVVQDILTQAIGIDARFVKQADRMRVVRHLKRWGWQPAKATPRAYRRPEQTPSEKVKYAGGPAFEVEMHIKKLCEIFEVQEPYNSIAA